MCNACAMPQPTTLLSAAEAADSLGVDRSTISRWVSSGRLVPAHKLPGRRGAYLFSTAAIEAARTAGDES